MNGFVLVATKKNYLEMSITAVNQLLAAEGAACPNIELFVSSELQREATLVHGERIDVRVIENPSYSFFDKISAINLSKFSQLVYIDVDTITVRKIFDDLVSALQKVELAVHFGMGFNMKWEFQSYPAAISQPNTGLIALNKNCTPALEFLEKWISFATTKPAPHDQPSFRAAILDSKIRFCHLGPEFNFQGEGFLLTPPRVYHFASEINHKRLENKDWCRRAINGIEEAFVVNRPPILLCNWRPIMFYQEQIGSWVLA